MNQENDINQLVTEALQGSREALEEIVRRIQKPVYSLALRMLLHPEDAEDAAQEILLTVITNLRGYRFEGTFRAWVMRIAANKLKGVRRTYAEKKVAYMENLDEIIDRAESLGWFSKPLAAPEPCLEVEMRSVCAHALLLALDRPHRMAFLLGVVVEVTSREGAQILDITPAAYRKRLSRARSRVKDFFEKHCDLFDSTNRCQCRGILPIYLEKGWINPDKLIFAKKPEKTDSPIQLKLYLEEVDDLRRLSVFYNSVPPSDFDFVHIFKKLYQSGKYRIISDPQLM